MPAVVRNTACLAQESRVCTVLVHGPNPAGLLGVNVWRCSVLMSP